MATPLSPGDIYIVGFRSAAPDGLAFVTFKTLAAGTQIGFTDASYQQSGNPNSWRGTENFAVWTANAEIPAGTVVVLTFPDSPGSSADLGSTTGNLNGLSGSGDQIFVYQRSDGTVGSTTPFTPVSPPSLTQASWNAAIGGSLLFGINFASANGFVTSGTANLNSTNTSYIPDAASGAGALTLGSTALSITATGVTANGQYTGPLTGLTAAEYQTAILNPANWTVASGALSSADFTLPGGPVTGAAPTITETSTTPFLNLPATGTGAVSGVLGDATDPASQIGVDFAIADSDTPVANLSVTVTSSNPSVVSTAGLVLTGSGATRNLKITPAAAGLADITITVSDGSNSSTYTINYAASAAANTPATTQFHTGTSDASTAIALDANFMVVADDEDQTIRLYDRNNSGLPLNAFNFTSNLGLTGSSEVDIEGATRVGNLIYWIGSHSNNSSGNDRPNRERIFSTEISGSGASTTLSFGDYYQFLEDDLIAWDNANGHGLGAGALGLAASAAVGVLPETPNGSGFNIEGITFAPDNTTAYIAFRAPISPASNRTDALIIPVTNFASLFDGIVGSAASGSAQFGAPIFLNLGGRGIREISRNTTGEYVIIAGPAGAATGTAPADFRLYTWDGNPNSQPVLRSVDLTALATGGSFESIVSVPDNLSDSSSIELLTDNGDTIWYNNGTVSKDLAQENWQKFRSDSVTLGAPIITTPPGVTITPSGDGTSVNEEGETTDTYAIALNTIPSGAVTVAIAADAQTQISIDGVNFFSSVNLVLSDTSPATVTVRAINDRTQEASPHTSTITHTLTSPDAGYNGLSVPNLSVNIIDNDFTLISQIQGSGSTFALGGTQTIEGVVVGSFLGTTGLRGFYVQEEDADSDGNDQTSEGIFVFDSSNSVASLSVGSKVRVTGTVGEFTSSGSSLTQLTLSSGSNLLNLGTTTLPTVTTVTLPVASVDTLERFEGMLVNVVGSDGPLTVTNNFTLGRFGEVSLSAGGRIFQYTQTNAPSISGNLAYQLEAQRRQIILDDGSSTQNPATVIHARGGQPLSASNTLRGGDAIASISGVLDQRFGVYRVQNSTGANFQPTNPRENTAPDVGGEIQIASFNLLNYFNGDGTGSGFMTSDQRGAENLAEFNRQRDKTISAILGTNAEIIGFNEMENDGFGSLSAIQDLVNGLNAATAPGTYAFVTPDAASLINGEFGGDDISVGFIYNTNAVRVAPGTIAAGLTTGAFTQGPGRLHRPPLAVTFERLDNGTPTNEIFTAVINHFKSKGSSGLTDTSSPNFDQGDGQSFWNAARTQAANDLAAWLATNPTGTTDPDTIILGDLNAYRLEDPIQALINQGYTSLFGTSSYSFQFQGQWGSLDHALTNSGMTGQVTGAAKWLINSDEPVALDYNTNFKSAAQQTSFYAPDAFKSSDHDPIVVGLNLGETPLAPTDITLDDSSIEENSAIGSTVGRFSTTDGNRNDTFTYSLVEGEGDTDNAAFTIDGDQLKLAIAPNFEARSSYTVRVQTTDQTGRSFTESFAIAITNVNEDPIAGDDSFAATEGTPLTITVSQLLGNDSDPDASTTLTLSSFTSTSNGSLTRNASGAFVYTANFGFSGSDSFTYTVSDGVLSDTATVTLTVAAFVNQIVGDNRNNVLRGTSRADTIRGLDGNDVLQGVDGNDSLFGDAGRDQLFGGNGNDTLNGGSDNDLLMGDAGDDVLNGDEGADRLFGGSGNDTLNGGSDNDFLEAGEGIDTLLGGLGNDTLLGGSGDDVLTGGNGADQLNGGAGRDRFVYTALSEAGDTVVDFNRNEDILDLTALFDTLGYGGSNPIADGFLQVLRVSGRTEVRVDADGPGGGSATLLTSLSGTGSLTLGVNLLF